MSAPYAFVTLLTSDAYLPGALTIAAALKDLHRSLQPDQSVEYETVCLVTPETVDVAAIRLLRRAFDVVVGVEIIDPPDAESLTLLGRPDLDTALTKLHVFRLAQYSKVIFLDADVLPLRPLSHLFHLDHEFSAVPDVGWPDIFNSGVMVLSPGHDKFHELRELLSTRGTWDGADQGLLNEWRGNNWSRLSFTYNTTPTAIYTYAPAYQRFGSQISAVHFIGPHKPWHSIPYRAPGSSSTQATDMVPESSIETTQPHAYDYASLVDRWYSVYDRHYRSQATEPVFQPTKYTSAWNEEGLRHTAVPGGALGLEELRRAALEGMGASGLLMPRGHGEGEYRIMPLEGRFDLIRPRTRAERNLIQQPKDSMESPDPVPVPEDSPNMPEPSTPPGQISSLPAGSPARWTTLPTPGVNEIPSAPHTRLMSLPSTPLRYTPAPHKLRHSTREAGAQTVSIQSQQQESQGTEFPPTPLTWSSVVEMPPGVATPVQTDTYFPKIWDADRSWSSVSPSSSETSFTTMETSPTKPLPASDAFFNPSLLSATPEALRHQGQYRNITERDNGSPTPDPTKVKRIFPWEERPRHAPGRVFPGEGPPPATPPHPPISATPERKAFHSPIPSPLIGFPPSLQSHTSDGPFLNRYAGKVSWSVPSPSPLGLETGVGKAETSSQDGDVEDEVDFEEEAIRSRVRSSSIRIVKRAPEYRSIGVQTDPIEVREEGVQVTTFVPVTEVAEKMILMNKRSRRNWPTSTGPTGSPSVATPLSTPTPDRSSLPSNLQGHHALTAPAPDETGDLSLSTLPIISSTGPSSVASGSPSHVRKGARVWNPARGVETFKRGSEEALTKFMKIGSLGKRA